MLGKPWVAGAVLVGEVFVLDQRNRFDSPADGDVEAVVEKPSPGETVVSGNNVIVDASGEEMYDINDFLTFFYRWVFFSIFCGTLLTLHGFLPKVRTGAKD